MKKLLSCIGKFFGITFALYTCVSYGMMLLNIATVNAEAPQWSGVALLFSHILLFSALTSLAITVVDAVPSINSALGHLLKFVVSYGAFYLCFFALRNSSSEPINIVVISAAFVVIYAVVTAAAALVRSLSAKKKNEQEEYKSIYEKAETEEK